MNNDDDRISPHPSSDHALEARIVAWVMGEASEFESAELTRLIAEKPALAAFKARIENTHRLLREAAGPDKKPLRLSAERRAKLLSALGLPENLTATDELSEQTGLGQTELASADPRAAASAAPPAAAAKRNLLGKSSVLTYPMAHQRRSKSSAWFRGLSIACSLMLTFLVLHVMVFAPKPHEARERMLRRASDSKKLASETMAREQANLRADRLEKQRSESSAKGSVPVQLPSAAPVANDIPFDAFNVDRIDLQRGPNSILFGVGSPSGIINGNLNGESFKDTQRLENRNVSTGLTLRRPDLTLGATSSPATAFSGRYETSAPKDSPVASPVNEEPIVLSPFVVNDSQDVNYTATSTLAGTRIRTDLRDAASSISAVTKEFLKDTGSSNNASQLDYGSGSKLEENKGAAPAVASAQLGELATDASPAQKTEIAAPSVPKPAAPAARAKSKSADEQSAQTQPVSTFSLHVSDVSLRLSADALASGEKPDPAAIRPEEFYNAFDYGDPAPGPGEAVSCRIEQSAHPTKQQRNLVRIALRVPSTGRAATQPLHLTILLDTSGSMQRRDRAASVKDAMSSLISLLKPNDQITLIGFARTPHLLAESVSGNDAKRLISIVSKTPAEGGTNLDAALSLASELAERHQATDALNRIVLITDGAANLGDADPKELSAKIEALRQKGIAFDACGVGTAGVDDAMLESLTRHGDGRYLLLDHASASAEFAKRLAGAFRPAAKNVKVQIRFNPNRVAHYRLLGFAQHRLKEEDFRNDKVDAAELAADEAANALYEVEPLPQGEGALGEVFVRFQDVATGQMVERSWSLPYDAKATRFAQASPSLQLAGTAALVAEYLQGEPVNLDDLVGSVNLLRDHYRNESRVQTLVNMFDQLRRIDRRY